MTPPVDQAVLRQRLVDAVSDAFIEFTAHAQGQRDDLLALTMSGLGGCSRQAAYRLARVPPSEQLVHTEMRAANIGTMIHLGLLPHLAEVLGGVEEIPVTLTGHGLTIEGRTDLYAPRLRTVIDLKTVGLSKFSTLSDDAHDIREHLLQITGYGQALRQAGKPVDWLAWIYLDRSGGLDHILVLPFDETLEKRLDERLVELATYAEQPDAAPREERGPGLSYVCDGCPWLRTCWGETAEPGIVGAQRTLVHDNAGVADALRLYDDARTRESEACADKEFARAMFSSYSPGRYGDLEFTWSQPGTTNDKDAAVKLLEQAGIPVPQKATASRLVVRRARSQPEA